MPSLVQIHKKIIKIRLAIRKKALLFAEHELYSLTLNSGGQLCICDCQLWRELVHDIEKQLLEEEDPSLALLQINVWEPLRAVFARQ